MRNVNQKGSGWSVSAKVSIALSLLVGVLSLSLLLIPIQVDADTGQPVPYDAAANAACQPLKYFTQPPSSFDPLTATDSQLEAVGFPPKPPGNDANAIAAWAQAVTSATDFTVPQPLCNMGYHTAYANGIWAGHVVPSSYDGGVRFTWSQSTWVEPTVPGNSNYTNPATAPTASIWTGIGVTNLIQAGVDANSTSTAEYHFWTEDFGYDQATYEGPAIRPGQLAYVHLWYMGNNVTEFFLENETTGNTQVFYNPTPAVGYNAANFIVERSGNLYLPQFNSVSVTGNDYGTKSNSYTLSSINNDRYEMTSNCTFTGTVLSEPSGVDNNGNFTHYWYASSPVCNS